LIFKTGLCLFLTMVLTQACGRKAALLPLANDIGTVFNVSVLANEKSVVFSFDFPDDNQVTGVRLIRKSWAEGVEIHPAKAEIKVIAERAKSADGKNVLIEDNQVLRGQTYQYHIFTYSVKANTKYLAEQAVSFKASRFVGSKTKFNMSR